VIALALGSLSVLGYTYVGYPILIGALARLFPMEVAEDASWEPKVTACIPVFNAARYLTPKIESLLALDWPADKLEILLYIDGSTDDTLRIATDLAARHPQVKVIVAEVRSGKPIGVNRMVQVASGEVLLMTDVRQLVVPGALRALVTKLADPRVACVSGNLVLQGESGAGVYWRYENWIRKQEAGFRGMVGVTGPLYVIRKSDMAPLPHGVILDDMWVPMRLRLEGRRILFADEAVCADDAFDDDREYGRKVRTLAGNYQLFALLPELLVPSENPSWFELSSHKLLRLACPWALLGLLASSSVLTFAPRTSAVVRLGAGALLGGQLVFYGMGALDVTRLGALARSFMVLNGAAVVGLYRFVTGEQKVTW
jgi:cellulose synthase/poly-beta-1,6-N-acetylglucosamine synthase-like glycosyltransferase